MKSPTTTSPKTWRDRLFAKLDWRLHACDAGGAWVLFSPRRPLRSGVVDIFNTVYGRCRLRLVDTVLDVLRFCEVLNVTQENARSVGKTGTDTWQTGGPLGFCSLCCIRRPVLEGIHHHVNCPGSTKGNLFVSFIVIFHETTIP